MSELLELAERCDAASEPDGELDYAIAYAVRGKALWQDCLGGFEPRPLTGSLDAAMLLVPDGWGWSMGTAGADAWASVWRYDEDREHVVEARTAPLAVCAAALRARALSTPQATNSGVDLDPPMKRI